MRTRHIIILIAGVLIFAGALWAQRYSPKPLDRPSSGKWEYGVYRRGTFYRYEWQDADERIYARTRKVFLERMRLFSMAAKLEGLTDAPQSSLDYVLDAEFLNHLGTQGWELIHVVDRGPGAIPNRTFWLKRR